MELRDLAEATFEDREVEPSSDFMETLRGGLLSAKPDRLSGQHLELRDQALSRFDAASRAVAQLEDLERGEVGDPIRSPRHAEVRRIRSGIASLREQLDRVYV